MPVQYMGLKDLEEKEVVILTEFTDLYFQKIERDLPNPTLIIHVKKHKPKGNAKKYSMHTRLEAPGIMLVTQEADWDFKRCIHKLYKSLINELQHKFKTEGHKTGKRLT